MNKKLFITVLAVFSVCTIKAQILKEYVNEEYEDIVAPTLTEIQKTDPHAHDGIIIAGICVVIIGIVGAVVYFGRKEN